MDVMINTVHKFNGQVDFDLSDNQITYIDFTNNDDLQKCLLEMQQTMPQLEVNAISHNTDNLPTILRIKFNA